MGWVCRPRLGQGIAGAKTLGGSMAGREARALGWGEQQGGAGAHRAIDPGGSWRPLEDLSFEPEDEEP